MTATSLRVLPPLVTVLVAGIGPAHAVAVPALMSVAPIMVVLVVIIGAPGIRLRPRP